MECFEEILGQCVGMSNKEWEQHTSWHFINTYRFIKGIYSKNRKDEERYNIYKSKLEDKEVIDQGKDV